MVARDLLAKLHAPVVVGGGDTPDDAGVDEGGHVAVGAALGELGGAFEDLGHGERPAGAGQHLDEEPPHRRVPLVVLVEPAFDRVVQGHPRDCTAGPSSQRRRRGRGARSSGPRPKGTASAGKARRSGSSEGQPSEALPAGKRTYPRRGGSNTRAQGYARATGAPRTQGGRGRTGPTRPPKKEADHARLDSRRGTRARPRTDRRRGGGGGSRGRGTPRLGRGSLGRPALRGDGTSRRRAEGGGPHRVAVLPRRRSSVVRRFPCGAAA